MSATRPMGTFTRKIGRQPRPNRLVGHLMHELRIEIVEFLLVEFRRRAGDVIEIDQAAKFIEIGDGADGFRRAHKHRQ